MSAKTFSVKPENKPGLHVTGFPANGHHAFVNLKFGDTAAGGEFNVIFCMSDARALARALENAINHAEPRAVEAADLGVVECIGKSCVAPALCANPNVRCALV